ncbi:MAG: hypothetical protein P1V18_00700 [Candidatus Gracilibacteria bacterium]|nr:hypothetical protein [Candidatus Gracilibacteria bacterium]
MKKLVSGLGILIIGILIGATLSSNSNTNTRLKYGSTGFPKNCRAIIKENIDNFHSGDFSAEDSIESIDRNCGEFGYSWTN